MFYIPIGIIFSWPLPNYVDPVTRGNSTTIVSGIFLAVSTIFVAIRLYQRIFVRKWFGPDDLFIILGYICSVAVTVITGLGDNHGWNKHIWDLHVEDYSPAMKLLYFARIFWGQSTSFVRLSVLCLYYRLLRASEASRRCYVILYITALLTFILQLYYLLSGIFPCTPIRAYWMFPMLKGSHCFNDIASFEAAAIVNTILEAWIATLPLLGTIYLKVASRDARSVLLLLCGGYIVTLAGVVRTYFVWKINSSYDLSWWSGPQWITSEIEVDLALICACAAPLRPLAARVVHRLARIQSLSTIRSLSRTRKESKSHMSSSMTDTQVSQVSHVSHDIETAQQWTEAMSRTIDLEGIADDGFGYTVTITGPINSSGRRPSAGLRLPWKHRTKTDSAKSDSAPTTMIKQTEVIVEKSYPLDRLQGSRSPQNRRTASISPDLDGTTLESMGLQLNGLIDDDRVKEPLQSQTLYGDMSKSDGMSPRFSSCSVQNNEPEEVIQALPIMPTAASSRSSLNREVSWFGDPPGKSKR